MQSHRVTLRSADASDVTFSYVVTTTWARRTPSLVKSSFSLMIVRDAESP